MKRFVLLLLIPFFAYGQDALTPEEQLSNVMALHAIQPIPMYKAPIDADLTTRPLPPLPVFQSSPVRTPRLQFELDYRQMPEPKPAPMSVELHETDADAAPPAEDSLPTTFATFHKPERLAPPQHVAVPGAPPPVTPCTGVCVTFSSQGDAAITSITGKKLTNFQAIEAVLCSSHPAQVPAGLILQMANAIGIATVQKAVGSAIVQQRVGMNWRSVVINSLKYGTVVALGIMSSGVFGTVSKGTLFVTAVSHEAADDLPKLFAPGAPNPDPYLSNTLDGSATLSLSPSNCQDLLFGGVFNGPGTSFVTPPIQLLP